MCNKKAGHLNWLFFSTSDTALIEIIFLLLFSIVLTSLQIFFPLKLHFVGVLANSICCFSEVVLWFRIK